MEDTIMFLDQEPLVMGMTPKEYQAAFSYLDHANFSREVEEFDVQRRDPMGPPRTNVVWYRRPEFWALVLGSVTLIHTLFIQWVWPLILRNLPTNSPYRSDDPQYPPEE
ncbi:hypothetical protein ANO14919_111760 [Xylariales sp. No.14919]|nr:hypothetical protein ANO14919_111760 [Xylariales sp. No.14919]